VIEWIGKTMGRYGEVPSGKVPRAKKKEDPNPKF
jgi:hypothetical protein